MSDVPATNLRRPPPPTPREGSVFAGFRRVLRRGALIFGLIVAALTALIVYQQHRAAEAIRSVEQTRRNVAAIDALRTYLLNLDNAVRKYAETNDPVYLDPNLICRRAICPSAERLIAQLGPTNGLASSLAPLPALQLALETGLGDLQQRAAAGQAATPSERDLSWFDKSAIDEIHRILIAAGREELGRLEAREKARIRDQQRSSALLGIAALWTGLALFGLYRETTRLIRAGMQAEDTIRQLSLHDPLTGLVNRRFLQENEHHLLAAAKRSARKMAVLVVDLDDFKAVNDTHGHAAGDEVLVAAAGRMKALLRKSDVIARFGGDEFVIVLREIEDASAAREIATRVAEQMSPPIPLADGGSARIGASIGIAMRGPGDETLADLLRRADEALYVAKRDRKGRDQAPGADTLIRPAQSEA